MAPDALTTYRRKRDFARTREPRGAVAKRRRTLRFVIQKHDASRLHFDLRLEIDGVYKSWAVPKGPSLDPGDKRLAVRVEDHPLEYGRFEGTIPEGEYGAGTVQLWDRGRFEPADDPAAALARGKLEFRLEGEKLRGGWKLVRMNGPRGEGGKNWLLFKSTDDAARTGRGARIAEDDRSVKTGRTLAEIAAKAPRGKKKVSSTAPEPRSATPRARAAARMPRFVPPQLCLLVDRPPGGEGWVHEIKFDGYRIQARVVGGRTTIFSRRGQDWTARFAAIAREFATLPDCVIDGEAVVLNAGGQPDFGALQDALARGDDSAIVCFAFDLLAADGEDLRPRPLAERKARLERLLPRGAKRVRYVEHFRSSGDAVLHSACRMALEGIISKRLDAPYRSGRHDLWMKSKCRGREEFVIGGYSAGTRGGGALGALMLGTAEKGGLRYRGRVGTGWGGEAGARLRAALERIRAPRSPFVGVQPARTSDVRWVEPTRVAEIEYGGWTRDGLLRHAAFKGLRDDKPAAEVRREMAVKIAPAEAARPRRAATSAKPARGRAAPPAAGVTNPDKVLWPRDGVTKGELAAYFERMADEILRFIAGRPLSMLRAPDGISRQLFFQRHAMAGMSATVEEFAVPGHGEGKPYVVVSSRPALMALAQMAVIELHPWGATTRAIDRPDTLTFDLDPGPGVDFAALREGALELRARLKRLGLPGFAKVTGGKGLHVVAPLKPKAGWAEAKALCRALAVAMASDSPRRYVAVSKKSEREGRIFVDYLRNDLTATAIACWSPRARDGARIATPVSWPLIEKARAMPSFTLRDPGPALRAAAAWKSFESARTPIGAAMLRALGVR